MRSPHIFIAYEPRAGLACALAFVGTRRDAYGWFIGRGADGAIARAYFVLEDYYTTEATRYVEVREEELHSGWTTDEARCHELARLQDAFDREWLFHRDDPAAREEVEAYAKGELAAGEVAVRIERIGRLDKEQPTWTYRSPGFDDGVLDFLGARWPLDFRSALV
jgi:hypothetical protein